MIDEDLLDLVQHIPYLFLKGIIRKAGHFEKCLDGCSPFTICGVVLISQRNPSRRYSYLKAMGMFVVCGSRQQLGIPYIHTTQQYRIIVKDGSVGLFKLLGRSLMDIASAS